MHCQPPRKCVANSLNAICKRICCETEKRNRNFWFYLKRISSDHEKGLTLRGYSFGSSFELRERRTSPMNVYESPLDSRSRISLMILSSLILSNAAKSSTIIFSRSALNFFMWPSTIDTSGFECAFSGPICDSKCLISHDNYTSNRYWIIQYRSKRIQSYLRDDRCH